MTETPFVPLHIHTDYSMLQSACNISKLAGKLTDFGIKAAALTDLGNMCGTMAFTNTLKKKEIKAIIGCYAYLNSSLLQNRSNHASFNGLILLAENQTGYVNLCSINAAAHLEGFHIKPRIDRSFLRAHSEGLIAIIPFHDSDMAAEITNNRPDAAAQKLQFYLDLFGPENTFIEIQKHEREGDQEKYNAIIEIAQEFNVPLVASNTVYYTEQNMAIPHDILCCVGEKTVHDPKNMRFPEQNYYLRSPQEMYELFADQPESLSNTVKIADRCNLELKYVNHYPVYPVAEGESQKQLLLDICIRGLKDRYDMDYHNPSSDYEKELLERTDFELGVITKSGYDSYFLVVWDFINWSKENDIPVGPGRGSGAGSIVAYLTGITNIDPIKYNLLFERFLNPERISPPDFDIDFCERRRGEVIEYVRQKYGTEKVAQIGTYGTLKAKAVIKDVTRGLGYDHTIGDSITKMMSEHMKMNLTNSLKKDPSKKDCYSEELVGAYDTDDQIRTIVDYAKPLEGLNRQMGIHACGVIIGDQDLSKVVPLISGANGEVVTQYAAGPCEDLGLLKMDFLGLRTLTLIKDTLALVKENHGLEIDIEAIPIDDKKTYKLFQDGKTTAVFQYESAGMQKYMKELQPSVFPDLIAMNALYRPGPIEYIPNFINRKHGREEITYDCEGMDEYLQETYGITVYQEQVMLLSQKLAGFTKGEADTLRKAMGKKKMDLLAELKPKFLNGGIERGHNKEKLEETWVKWEAFASYAFNKSHSTCYAWVAYQTAYLKAHYAPEFMAAVMTSEISNADKVAFFLEECRNLGLKVLPPNVNKSRVSFCVEDGAIRFGLGAIKGVGTAASESIVKGRAKGEYQGFMDLCEKISGGNVSRKVLVSLVATGAMDDFGHKRSAMTAFIEPALEQASSKAADLAIGQMSLFAEIEEVNTITPDDSMPEWDGKYKLEMEKTLLGFYASGHPIGEYKHLVKKYSTQSITGMKNQDKTTLPVRVGVMISNVNLRKTRKGKTFASFSAEDLSDSIECICWDYDKNSSAIKEDAAVLLEGEYSRQDRTQIIVRSVIPIGEAVSAYTDQTLIIVRENEMTPEKKISLQHICDKMPRDITDYEKRALTTKALQLTHKSQQELLPKFEKYLNDITRTYQTREELENFLLSPQFASFNNNTLLQMDQKKQLLSTFRSLRSAHRLLIVILTEDKQEVWLEPAKDKQFLPTWDFIRELQSFMGDKCIKLKENRSLPEVKKRFQHAG